MTSKTRIDDVRRRIAEQEASLAALKQELASLEAQDGKESMLPTNGTGSSIYSQRSRPLEAEEYTRYGRQMILPDFGLPGQLNLKNSRVLIIGVGGLGCPAAAYLAGSGIGTIGLVDGDVVEISNLHRQILHSTGTVGLHKVDSAAQAIANINPHVKCVVYRDHLDINKALEIFPEYDLILDCTDSPQTRYMISDAAVLCSKPSVSASALRTDGQLLILNHPPTKPAGERTTSSSAGPCYRCVFPRPPPPESVTSCGEGGILGPVVGVMGVLMALEATRLISSGSVTVPTQDSNFEMLRPSEPPTNHSMMMLSASAPGPSTFRHIRLKGKRADCFACGVESKLSKDSVDTASLDYAAFCGVANPITVLAATERINPEAVVLQDITMVRPRLILIDVRPREEYSICSISGSFGIPWSDLQTLEHSMQHPKLLMILANLIQQPWVEEIVTICRLGNDSQLAVRKLQQLELAWPNVQIKDVAGGFKAWRRDVDPDWPLY